MFEPLYLVAPVITLVVCAIVIACIHGKKTHNGAFVEANEDGDAYVRGDAHDIAVMMVACALALEREGFDMTEVKTAIGSVKRKNGGTEDAEDT